MEGESTDLVRKCSIKKKNTKRRREGGGKACVIFISLGRRRRVLATQEFKENTRRERIATHLKQRGVAVYLSDNRRGSRFLLCRALIESTVRHQAGQYEIITPHNGHKTTDSERGRKGFTLRDSLHAFVCRDGVAG